MRRRNNKTRSALKAHIGRLISIPFVHDTDNATNQASAHTKQPSPVRKKEPN